MADKGKEEESGKEEAAAPKSKKKLFIIIGGVVGLLILGIVLSLVLGGKKPEEGAAAKPVETVKHYATVPIPTIIVNLSESASFLKVGLLIEYDPEIIARAEPAAGGEKGGGHGGGASGGGEEGGKGGLPGPLAKREPMIKDAIIRVLASKKASELLTTEGKEKLKEELIEGINEASGLEEGPVVAIYFTEFIIQ